MVLGLNLCPFAHAPWRAGRVRWQLCPAATLDELLALIEGELCLLHAQEAHQPLLVGGQQGVAPRQNVQGWAPPPDPGIQTMTPESRVLATDSASGFETTLLVLPNAPADFDSFNDWVGLVEGLLPMLRLRGQIQVVGFHPGFVFDDLPPEDPGNGVNRSPWPMLHLLLESSISRVVDAGANIEAITERNQRILRG